VEFLTIPEIVKAAVAKLPPEHWHYLSGGSDSEATLRQNRAALDAIGFRPRVLRDVSKIDCRTDLFGQNWRLPVVLAPIGGLALVDPEGGLAAAKAAEVFGILPFVSVMGFPALDVVAANTEVRPVFQLYVRGDRAWVSDIVTRARAAGFRALCLTVDTALYGRRERDLEAHFSPASAIDRPNVAHLLGRDGDLHQAAVDWDMLAYILSIADMPVVLKGVMDADDASRAVDAGVHTIYVSNHGGRQLDYAPATIEVLPEIAAVVKDRARLIVDGGMMRGSDVIKALALGADAVGLGKLQAYALAAGGVPVLIRALEILEIEIRTTLGLIGVTSFAELSPQSLRPLPHRI
jgi:isopentenyl diphosphate isomerase/L-lactate dehydrogenase-like FMN-dependent dehydrogenase